MKNSAGFRTAASRLASQAGFLAVTALVMAAPLFANAATLNRQLETGDSGSDVSSLQTYLATDVTIYPQGLVTGYFGFLTKSAVSNFQSRNGISAVGRVGPVTLVALNARMSGTVSGADVYAPLITSLNQTFTATNATINWTTSEPARGKLYFSTSPIRLANTFDETGLNFVEPYVSGTVASFDNVQHSAQSVSLANLSPDTTYYYLALALDASNNSSITLPSSFHTSK